MNTTWFFILLAATAPSPVPALDARLAARNLDLFFPKPANKTSSCPATRPESCDCERFREKDSAKYFQCATDPFCERCAHHWHS